MSQVLTSKLSAIGVAPASVSPGQMSPTGMVVPSGHSWVVGGVATSSLTMVTTPFCVTLPLLAAVILTANASFASTALSLVIGTLTVKLVWVALTLTVVLATAV
jgi:ABC-type transport system involved in cytochrome c biogenesis permease component